MAAESKKVVVVVGAGLTGCCIALLLSRSEAFKDHRIIVMESRDDYRKERQKLEECTSSRSAHGQFDNAATRSINLALSHRGICALKACGVYDEIVSDELLILMRGRYVHLDGGQTSQQLYGQSHDAIYSVSWMTLNCLFLDKLAARDNVELVFNCKIKRVKCDATVLCDDEQRNVYAPQFVLGCDGAFSATRASLQRCGRYNFSIQYIEHGYKELTIFAHRQTNEFKMPANYLHIWPRHEFMLIGLPNPDKTFTCTLFAPWPILETLDNKESIELFFKTHFADFIELCPNYAEQCLRNPSSPLAHINLSKWNHKNKILLLGDAAHAIVPFYGQGMNAGLEDCLILHEMLANGTGTAIESVFDAFSEHRQPSTDALSRLSLQNYVEMRSLTAKQWFVYKKKVEKTLNYYAPSVWQPIYSMVAFSRTPYNQALERAQKQDTYLSTALSATALLSAACIATVAYRYDAVSCIKAKFPSSKSKR